MKRIVPLILAAALAACSKQEPATDTAPAAPPSPAAPAPEDRPAPLTAAQQAVLVRPHAPILGDPKAPVTVVEFLDPACGACRNAEPLVKQMLFMYPQGVRVVVRFAAFHQGSDEAIRILYAAQRQRKFDRVLTALFDGQEQWASHNGPNTDNAWKLAGAAGLDLAAARRDANSQAATELLRVDGEDGVVLKVDSTPTFYVNGELIEGMTAEQFFKLIEDEVKAAGSSGTSQ